MLITTTIIMALVAKFLKESPIEYTNNIIGYRTKRAVANEHNWILAQKVAFEIMYKIYFIISLTFVPLIVIDLFSLVGILNNTIFTVSIAIQAVISVLGIIIVYVYTENVLKTKGQP